MKITRTFVTIVCLLCAQVLNAQLIRDPQRLKQLDSDLKIQQELAKKRDQKLFKPLATLTDPDEKQALSFILAYAPLSDLAGYDGNFFLENVRVSLKARKETLWGMSLPEDVFLHFVLPLRVNNENLDSFRIQLYPELMRRIKGMAMREAALEINHWCHEKVTYKASDARTSSPLASMKTSWGRCGEESTFAVTALRTVGIPARQVYTPRWAHSDDNHAWVEVWIDGKWFFLGACEPEPELNMGWFAGPAKRAMLVHTRAYGNYIGTEPVITREDRFAELNLIANYAPVRDFVVKVVNKNGQAVAGAKVEYRLYNYAELYPIAKSVTDKKGFAGITTGFGDLVIWASSASEYAYQKVSVELVDTLILTIKSDYPAFYTESLDLIPPIMREVVTGDETGRQENSRRLLVEDSIRNVYMKTFRDSAWITDWAKKLNIDEDTAFQVINGSYGNWQEISNFVASVSPEQRSMALLFLKVLSEKDLRDARASVLNDHFVNAMIFYNAYWQKNKDFFARYIMSGRINTEMMLDWRQFLNTRLKKDLAVVKAPTVAQLINWNKRNISINNQANLHSRAIIDPEGAYRLGVVDKRSRDVLFVAACRSFGIPARIDLARSVPQYWANENWIDVAFEKTTTVKAVQPKGYLSLTNPSSDVVPAYTTSFTLSRFVDGSYDLLEYPEEQKLGDFPEKMEMDTGKYLLTTGNRLDDGKVLASLDFFRIDEGKTCILPVRIREQKMELKSMGKLILDGARFQDIKDLQTFELINSIGEKGAFLIWIDPDKEPTKHIMVDIPLVKTALDKSETPIIFLIPENKMSMSFRPGNFKNLPEKTTFGVDNSIRAFMALQSALDRKLAENYPFIAYVDGKSRILYFSEGYRIGIGEQMVKMLSNLK